MTEPSGTPADRRSESFDDFWQFYLREHAKPATRALHYLGTGLFALGILAFVMSGNLWFVPAALAAASGPAWIGHLFIENNRPTAFTRFSWSLACDFRMTFSWLTGHINEDLKRAGVRDSGA
jgi:hypothetical protein